MAAGVWGTRGGAGVDNRDCWNVIFTRAAAHAVESTDGFTDGAIVVGMPGRSMAGWVHHLGREKPYRQAAG